MSVQNGHWVSQCSLRLGANDGRYFVRRSGVEIAAFAKEDDAIALCEKLQGAYAAGWNDGRKDLQEGLRELIGAGKAEEV